MSTKTKVNPLFRDRVPEAAAQQLAVVLAQAAEWALEDFEDAMRRRTSRKRLAQMRNRCRSIALHCEDLNVEPRGLGGVECPLLAEAIERRKWEKGQGTAGKAKA